MTQKKSEKYSGRTSAYQHKHPGWEEHMDMSGVKKAVRKIWILDAQWTDCPVEVEAQVRKLWSYAELGNDHYVYKITPEELQEMSNNKEDYPNFPDVSLLVDYLVEMGVPAEDEIWIHWWW